MAEKTAYTAPSLQKLALPEVISKLMDAAAHGHQEAVEMLDIVQAMTLQAAPKVEDHPTAGACDPSDQF